MTRKTTHKKTNSTGRNKKLITIILVLVVLSIAFIATAMYVQSVSRTKPFEVREMPYDFKVKPALGFNVDTDLIHMGGGPAGVTLTRNLTIRSEKDAIVKILMSGPGNLTVDKNNFLVSANTSTQVAFVMVVPQLPMGNYTGMVHLEFYNPKYWRG